MTAPNAPSVQEVEAGARAYVQWINPPHSTREPTDEDRQRVRAIVAASRQHRVDEAAFALQRADDLVAELRRHVAALERQLERASRPDRLVSP